MELVSTCRGIRASSEERIKRLKKILHSLATRIPVIVLKRVEKRYPSLQYNMTVSISNSTMNDSRHHDAKYNPENSQLPTCKKCHKTFVHRDFLYAHQCRGFVCKICNKSYPFNSYLKRHMLSHINSRHSDTKCNSENSQDLKCQKCKKTFVHQDFFDAHECRNFDCKICNKSFPSNCRLKRHMLSHFNSRHSDTKCNSENSQDLKCQKCKKTFVHQDSFDAHECRNFDCKICNKSFPSNCRLKRHMLSHFNSRHSDTKCNSENSQDLKCLKCKRTFVHQDFFDAHECRNFDCKICNKSFPSNCRLKRHMLSHFNSRHSDTKCNSENSQDLKCLKCKRTFVHQDFFDAHECRNFDCKICNKSFPSNCRLKRHMLSHFNSRHSDTKCNSENSQDLKCLKCQRTFICQNFFNAHECRKFVCEICNMLFPFRCYLERHISTHTYNREKSHKCDKCGRYFKRHCDLTQHSLAVHEKKIRCDICNRRFLKKNNMMNHKRVHYRESKHLVAANTCTGRDIQVHEGDQQSNQVVYEGDQQIDQVVHEGGQQSDEICEGDEQFFRKNCGHQEVYGESMEDEDAVEHNSEEKTQVFENSIVQKGLYKKDLNEFVEEETETSSEQEGQVIENGLKDNEISVEMSQPHQIIQTSFEDKFVNNNPEDKVNAEINSLSGENSKQTEVECKQNRLISHQHSEIDNIYLEQI